MIRVGYGTCHFLYSKKGINQGDPLTMVLYGLGIPPLVQELRKAHPGVTQTWYADDAGAGGTNNGIHHHLDDLMVRGPPYGYFPESTKSILGVCPRNLPRV